MSDDDIARLWLIGCCKCSHYAQKQIRLFRIEFVPHRSLRQLFSLVLLKKQQKNTVKQYANIICIYDYIYRIDATRTRHFISTTDMTIHLACYPTNFGNYMIFIKTKTNT